MKSALPLKPRIDFNLSSLAVTIASILIMLSAAFCTSMASGQVVDISECANIEAAPARYACYDELSARSQATAVKESVVSESISNEPGNNIEEVLEVATEEASDLPVLEVTPRPEPDTTLEPSTEELAEGSSTIPTLEEFGTTTPGRIVETEAGEAELLDQIVSLRQTIPNQWIITLASGQVWAQVNSRRFRLLEGMEVRIYRAPLKGSYRLARLAGNGYIQVERRR